MEIEDLSMSQYIKLVIYCLIILILLVSSIPYALIKGLGNMDYYEEWADFFLDRIPGTFKIE